MSVVGGSSRDHILKWNRGRRRVADLNARLGEPEVQKPVVVGGTASSAMAITIVVDDDDDDVVMSSPRSFAQAKSMGRSMPRRVTRQSGEQEDLLELRLGPGGSGSSTFRIRALPQVTAAPSNEDCVLLSDNPRKRKRVESVVSEQPKVKEGPKFVCPICMDTMKLETSTVCGHIFCQACIKGAIQAQKKCPTCRKKLSAKEIHRIYIQSSTD